MPLTLLALDCDGIILESVDAKRQAFLRMAEPLGQQAVDCIDLYHTLHGGVSRYEKIKWMYTQVFQRECTPEELEHMGQRFADFSLENVLNAPLVPGIQDVLDRWKGRVPIHVCSGTPHAELSMVLEKRGLAPYFAGMWGTPPAKAKLLERVVLEARVDPAEVVMVGDASTDMHAAETVGTRFYGRGREFEGSGHAWGEDLTGLNAWLEALS